MEKTNLWLLLPVRVLLPTIVLLKWKRRGVTFAGAAISLIPSIPICVLKFLIKTVPSR